MELRGCPDATDEEIAGVVLKNRCYNTLFYLVVSRL